MLTPFLDRSTWLHGHPTVSQVQGPKVPALPHPSGEVGFLPHIAWERPIRDCRRYSLVIVYLTGPPDPRQHPAAHTGHFISGRMKVVMHDGEEMDYGPGDFAIMAPGHDAWICRWSGDLSNESFGVLGVGIEENATSSMPGLFCCWDTIGAAGSLRRRRMFRSGVGFRPAPLLSETVTSNEVTSNDRGPGIRAE